MKQLQLIIIIFITTLLLPSCYENNSNKNKPLEDCEFHQNLTSINLLDYYTLDEIEKNKNKEICTPSYEVQKEIYANLVATDYLGKGKEFISNNFGEIRWNWSYFNINTPTYYLVWTPMYKESELTAIICYANTGDNSQINMKSIYQINQETENFLNIEVEEFTGAYIYSIQTFYKVQYNKESQELSEWLKRWYKKDKSN